MTSTKQNQTSTLAVTPTLSLWVDGFLVSKRAEGRRPRTRAMYQAALRQFSDYAARRNVTTIEAIDAGLIREYLLSLEETGHNPGGVAWFYRPLKTFFLWYEQEAAPDGWRNPIRKIKAPKVPEKILEPVSLADVGRLVATCDGSPEGLRDRAILLTLIDTGARAGEMVSFDVTDLDQVNGALTVRESKSGKSRTVFLGRKARRAVRAYLKVRDTQGGALFATRTGTRLTYAGLRQIARRRAARVGLPEPGLHSFRRACALNLLRAGVDLLTIQRLLGHADLSVLKFYAKQNTDDIRAAVERASAGDKL